MKIVVCKFRLGPIKRFNGGNPKAIPGTNLLTRVDMSWKPVEWIDLGDDQWKIEQDKIFEEENDARLDALIEKIKKRKREQT